MNGCWMSRLIWRRFLASWKPCKVSSGQRARPVVICSWRAEDAYDYSAYRRHLLSGLGWSPALFSEIHPYSADARRDRIWRFMTLLFMDQAREVDLCQHGSDLMIRRLHHEAD